MSECPNCGRPTGPEERFCARCGTQIAPESGPGSLADPKPAPDGAVAPASLSSSLGRSFLLLAAFGLLVVGAVLVAGQHRPLVVLAATPVATASPLPVPTSTAVPTATSTVVPTPTAVPTATPVPFRTESFNIAPRSNDSATYTIDQPDGRLQGYVLITGGHNDIGVRLRAPDNSYLLNVPRATGRFDFDVRLPVAGPYTVFFDNSFSLLTSKAVTMYFRILD